MKDKKKKNKKDEEGILNEDDIIEEHPPHRGNPVKVGKFTVFAGGTRDLQEEDLAGYDLLIALTGDIPPLPRVPVTIWNYSMEDFGEVPEDWEVFLRLVIQKLRSGQKILAFCVGSHGRTGTFLASLIALLEPKTDDPIGAARERHCQKAVESLEQAEAIFALKNQKPPKGYKEEFENFNGTRYDWKPYPIIDETLDDEFLNAGSDPWNGTGLKTKKKNQTKKRRGGKQ